MQNPTSSPTKRCASDKLLVFGGSGHAKDVIGIARKMGYSTFEIVTSDGSSDIPNVKVTKESDFRVEEYIEWCSFVAIGNNVHRKRFFEAYPQLRYVSIVSPSADVSETCQIADGCYIGSQSYVGPDANLGQGCIVNTQSIVGHDSRVGDFTQVGPQVCISGNVHIGKSVQIGAGVLFNNGSPSAPLTVPDQVTIGMGCHITASIQQEGLQIIPKPNHIGVRPQA